MVTITIDEATLNATRAALDERVQRLEGEIAYYHALASSWPPYIEPTEDAQRALVWNIAALHETRMAQEFYAEVEPEQADPITAAMGWHDWQAVGPR